MSTSRLQRRLAPLAALLLLGNCELATVELVLPLPDMVVAEVTVVLTVDAADPSRRTTDIRAITTRFPKGGHPTGVHGATVRVIGESGRSILLSEEPDPETDCMNRGFFGSCYTATAPSAIFAPGERLSLEVTGPNVGVLTGVSRMPGLFSPTGLSLVDGRCRLTPATNHRFTWPPVQGAAGYLAEARIEGELTGDSDGNVHISVTLIGSDVAEIAFPREFLRDLYGNDWELARVLRTGLPDGTTADIAVGAIDRNWINWIREGRINLNGEVRTPSVFGDGSGMFGTAVRWKVSVESRRENSEGAGDPLPLCGPAA